jgi:hypothetical protein
LSNVTGGALGIMVGAVAVGLRRTRSVTVDLKPDVGALDR